MKHNFSVSFADSYKSYGLPLIYIEVTDGNGLGFEFLIDTSTKYNWIDPEFISFFTINKDNIPPAISSNESLDFAANLFEGVYEELGSHKIIGRNGSKKVLDKVRFNFNFEGKSYSEVFSISNTIDSFQKIKKAQVVALLGGEFLKKNKWVVDYSKLLIYSEDFK